MHHLTPSLRRGAVAIAVTCLLTATGCADMSERERGTATGAAGGAAAGAVLGAVTGGRAGTGALIGGALGAIGGNLWSKRQEDRRTALEAQTRGTGIEVSRTADNQLKVNIPSDISFDTGSATIKPSMRSVLDPFAASVQNDPTSLITIVGHTDSTGSNAVNQTLSVQRANSVRDYLVDHGVSAGRIATAGRGENQPIADNSTDAGRAKNRRVEILLREPESRAAG